ncbi:MAG: AI-2E family transporter [Thermomicrobiales bacterium]|nr:AI-2E family transporter [Thermomicrobiales bacterium]
MQSELTPGRVMVLTASALSIIGVAWILIQIRSLFALLIIGMVVAAAIEPSVRRLRRLGLTQAQGILTIYGGLLALIAFLLVLVVPPLGSQASDLIDDIPIILQELRRQTADSPNSFINTTVWEALARTERAWIEFRTQPNIESQQAVSLVSSTFGVLIGFVTIFMTAFYWLSEKSTIKRVVVNIFAEHRREQVLEIWESIEVKLGGWIRGQLVLCLIIGISSTVFYFALDLPFWLALGIFAGITEIVPFIGPIIGGGAAVLIALTDSWQKALIVLAFVIILQQVESAALVPRVMKNAVGMSPLTVILAVLIGGRVGGVTGSILAIPVGAMIQVFVQVTLRSRLHFEEVAAEMAEDIARSGTGPTESGRVQPGGRPRRPRDPRRRKEPQPASDGASVARDNTSSSSSSGGEPGAR